MEPTSAGTTLPDAGEHEPAYSSDADGWTHELGEPVAYLDGRS